MTIDFKALTAPFPPEAISWRVGSTNQRRVAADTNNPKAKPTKGMALAYIDARDVMERLDEVCGPSGWQCRYPHASGKTVCELGIKIDDEWVWKADGAGDTDHEAEKGALSDAFKRAAFRWGIGRYLYHLASPWIELDERGGIPEHERRKLDAMVARVAAPLSPAVLAASTAIGLCATEAELSQWYEANKTMIDKMGGNDKADVRRIYGDRLKVLRAAAPKADDTPFDDERKAA